MLPVIVARLTLVVAALSAVLAGCQNVRSTHDHPPAAQAGIDHPHPPFWRKHHHPPVAPEFKNVCTGKNIGDSITITLQNGQQIQGKCELRFKPDSAEQPAPPPASKPA